jgi:hypothetical protein
MASLIETRVTFDMRELERSLTWIERRQLPFATMLALNETVKGGRLAVQKEMDRVFDRPTPYAKRGVVYEAAEKDRLEAKVVIYGSNTSGGLPAAAFLGPQIVGGKRSLKSFERQLQQRGLMDSGMVAVPAKQTKLDRYGNVSSGLLNRMMADLQIDYRGAGATRARSDASLKRNKNYRKARFFVPPKGSKLFPGIYQRDPRTQAIVPVMLFVKQRGYRKRLDFHGVVQRHADATLEENFAVAFARAMRTARR